MRVRGTRSRHHDRPSPKRRPLGNLALGAALLAEVGCGTSGAGTTMGPTGATNEASDAVAATTASATPAPEPSPIGEIVVSKDGCTVDGLEGPLTPGPIALTIHNQTDAFVVANMSKIREDGTYGQLEAHIAMEIRLAEAGKTGLGHPSYAPPSFDLFVEAGESDMLIGEVTTGIYAIVCGRTFEEVGEVRPSAVLGPYRVE